MPSKPYHVGDLKMLRSPVSGDLHLGWLLCVVEMCQVLVFCLLWIVVCAVWVQSAGPYPRPLTIMFVHQRTARAGRNFTATSSRYKTTHNVHFNAKISRYPFVRRRPMAAYFYEMNEKDKNDDDDDDGKERQAENNKSTPKPLPCVEK